MSNLFIVATPIGNKEDISKRALDVLKNSNVIACEDSRVSKKLLEAYGISNKLLSYHKFNEKQRSQEILEALTRGEDVALISDAGMPCISDPGKILVKEVSEKLPEIKITCIPGASAITTFLALIPRDNEEFAFVGFLPRSTSQQEKLFFKYEQTDMIFFEAANRLIETIENIKLHRGDNCKISIGRELTKVYEEVKTGTPDEILSYYESHTLKGEVVGMIYADDKNSTPEKELSENIKKLKELNYSAKDISVILSSLFNVNKNAVYKLALKN